MYKVASFLLCTNIFFSPVVFSTSAATISVHEQQVVTKAIDRLAKQTKNKIAITDIETTPIPGLLQVTSDLNVFYITSDGKYLVLGEILDSNQDKGKWSITELAARKLRSRVLAELNPQEMIIYPAMQTKIGTVTVFTDIDCPYCRKMQQDIKQYTDAGIEIRYLAFPRGGARSKGFEEAVYIWCAKDKVEAYTAAAHNKEFAKKSCVKNPVAAQFELGQRMGVTGTPTIFLENGVKLGGFVGADKLAKIIKEQTE